jgi:hypothetical protein
MQDVAESAEWYFGIGLEARARRSTGKQMEARRCAYAACKELGFSWAEIAKAYDRDRTTVLYAFSNGHQSDPDDIAAVLANARARALADSG